MCKAVKYSSAGYNIILCLEGLEHICGYVIPRIGNIAEEKSHVFHEMSVMAVGGAIAYSKTDSTNF
jgi:hypothetical protein